jgi:hypothetical protein
MNDNSFESRALPIIARQIPIIPVPARTKAAKLSGWPELATTDPAKIAEWAKQDPDANIACVAKPDGYWFFELDRDGLLQKIEQETKQKFPATLMVRSSPGRGHVYFKQNVASVAMGNRQAKDAHGELWSARVTNKYVIGPNSVHPSGAVYTVIVDAPIVEAPQWLIDYCIANTTSETTKSEPTTDESPILEGSRNSSLASILGKARQNLNLSKEELYGLGCSINSKRCYPPLPDSEVRTIANSIGGYAVTPAPPVILNGKEVGQPAPTIEPAKINALPYPKFPEHVLWGIPAYEQWVKPFCKVNSRYPEYMMLPLMVLVMNYMSTKNVNIDHKAFPLSVYLLMVGRKGRVIKSSSAQDAIEFCSQMEITAVSNSAIRNAEGKSIVFTVGSTEGLGSEMARINCKSAVLFYDEFSKLIAKMGIENSSFANDLSTCYESGQFANKTKSRKDGFSFEPGSYCLSLIGCTTDKRYPRLASKLYSSVDGMDERFFVLYQPEVLKDVEPLTAFPIPNGLTAETRKLIDKAVDQGTYSIDFSEPLRAVSKLGNRIEIRAEKWALCFAVLLGRDSIDDECISRGIALSKYEHAVKEYLQVGEAFTRDAAIQREIRLTVERAGGSIKLRELQRKVNYDAHGTTLWYATYGQLLRSGILAESGAGIPGDPKLVKVIVPLLRDEDED